MRGNTGSHLPCYGQSRVQELYCQAKCAAELAWKITRIWEGLSGYAASVFYLALQSAS